MNNTIFKRHTIWNLNFFFNTTLKRRDVLEYWNEKGPGAWTWAHFRLVIIKAVWRKNEVYFDYRLGDTDNWSARFENITSSYYGSFNASHYLLSCRGRNWFLSLFVALLQTPTGQLLFLFKSNIATLWRPL